MIKTHVLYPPFIIFILSIWKMIYLLLFKVIQSMILMEKKRIINVLQSLELSKQNTDFVYFCKKKLCVHSNFFIYLFFFWERESIILILFFYVCHIYHNFILFFPLTNVTRAYNCCSWHMQIRVVCPWKLNQSYRRIHALILKSLKENVDIRETIIILRNLLGLIKMATNG